jgi:hypothetical protein
MTWFIGTFSAFPWIPNTLKTWFFPFKIKPAPDQNRDLNRYKIVTR